MCTSLQDIWNDEYAAFKVESTKMRFFRLSHLYGLISSFVSIFLDSHLPITMSLDIITLVGSLISLYLSRLLRLKESIEGQRASSLRLATFGVNMFHSSDICVFCRNAHSYHFVSVALPHGHGRHRRLDGFLQRS